MLNKKPIIRTHQLRSGCVIPVGWFFESILLILLVCAVRDLSSSVARIAEAMERLEKKRPSISKATRISRLPLNPRAKGVNDNEV